MTFVVGGLAIWILLLVDVVGEFDIWIFFGELAIWINMGILHLQANHFKIS